MGSMGSQRHQWGPRRPPAAVVVGADRIAANGDTANKIGTYSLAVAALHHGVPFYVAAPSSSWDPNVPNGASIPIEERPERELTELQGVRVAPHGEEPTWGWGAAGEGVIGCPPGVSWVSLGVPWMSLGATWGALGVPRGSLGCHWGVNGCPPGVPWVSFGCHWVSPGGLLGVIGGPLDVIGCHLGGIGCPLGVP